MVDDNSKKTEEGTFTGSFKVQKRNDEKHIAFGWAYQCVTKSGEQLVDHSGDIVEVPEIEKAAYNFMEFYREGSDNHDRGGIGTVVESMVFTKEKSEALGIPAGTMPEGWWIGLKVTDDDVWKKVKDGTYSMFSIEGRAKSVPLD